MVAVDGGAESTNTGRHATKVAVIAIASASAEEASQDVGYDRILAMGYTSGERSSMRAGS
jgi:hypothetical protein